MKIKAIIYDNIYNKIFDISDSIGDLQISSWIEDQPGKCTFTVYKSNTLAFWEGATITIMIDGKGVFKGYIQKKERNSDTKIIKCTAYDQLLYWKSKDMKKIEDMTSDQVFEMLCKERQLKYEVIDKSNYICTSRIAKDESLYEMMKYALYDTHINSGKWFIIRDNFGVLNHINITSLRTNLIFGDNSGITDFSYSSDISSDTYNYIKLYKDNDDSGKRETYTVEDSTTIARWGQLQLYEGVNDNMTPAQIEERAKNLLKYHNTVKRTLKLECLGDFNVFAGSIIRCSIYDLGDLSINSDLLVTECVHKITNDEHTMSLRVELVIP